MLHDFLIANREELIVRCRVKAAKRRAPIATDRELQYGVPVFLDQLSNVLSNEHLDEDAEPSIGRSSPVETEVAKKLDQTADRHGKELQVRGFTVDQVVHGYGDVCQAVTELAMETHVAITVAEFHILNRSLDSAIAHAVSRFALGREQVMADNSERTLNESLGFLAHEYPHLVEGYGRLYAGAYATPEYTRKVGGLIEMFKARHGLSGGRREGRIAPAGPRHLDRDLPFADVRRK